MTTMTNEIRPTAGLRRTFARRLLLLLLLLTAGAGGAWGQATYTYIVGEDITQAPAAGTTVSSVPGITMTWGTTNSTDGYDSPTFSYQTGGTAPSSAFTTNYVLGGNTWPKTSDKLDPSDSNGAPYYGCYLKFTATAAGTLTLGLYDGSTTSSVMLMTVDGSDNKSVTAHLEGGSDNSYTGSFTYSVTTVSGYTYYLYVPSGTEIGLFGFAFTPTNTTYATAQNWDIAGAPSTNRGDYSMGTDYAALLKESVDLFPGLQFKVAASGRKLHYTEHGITQAEGAWNVLILSSYVPSGAIVEIMVESLDKSRVPDFSIVGASEFATNPVFTSSNWTSYTLRYNSNGIGDITLNCGNNTYLHSIKISTLSFGSKVYNYTIGTSDLTALPLLTNKGSGTVTYSSSNNAVVSNGFGRVKGPGVAYLTATSTDGSTASCKFVVTANEATATNTGSTFTFTANGLYRGSSLVELNGMTMRLGNGSETLVVENKSEAGGLAVKVMDGNGYFFRIAGETPPTMGTVYRLRVETEGTFTATGYFTANTKLINPSGTNQTFSSSGTSLTATLTPGTYYLYNDSGSDADVLWLHSFGFTPNTFVTVGQSQYWFIPTLTNATFTVTDGASLLSIEHGVVKINQSFTAFDDYGYAYGTVHAVYENSTTEDFRIRVKKDSWDFSAFITTSEENFGSGWELWSDISATKGMQFKGNWNTNGTEKALHVINGKSGSIKLPVIGGQTLRFLGRRGSSSQDIAITNLTNPSPNHNGHIRNADGSFAEKSAKAVSGASWASLSLSANDAEVFFKDFTTQFPQNPAASSSFLQSTYTMSLSATPRAAQIVSGTDPSAKTVFYYSSDETVATVDPWTGFVTTHQVGTATIHAHPLGVVGAYNSSATDISYTLTVIAKAVRSTTISVADLCYEEGMNANYNLSRTIPDFNLTVDNSASSTIHDGLKIMEKSGVNTYAFRKKADNEVGQLVITPRLLNSERRVLFTSVTLTTPEVKEGSVIVNGHTATVNKLSSTTITLTKDAAALSTSLYHKWTGVGADATITGESVSSELNKNTSLSAGNLVYGLSTVPSLTYADLTGYNKIVITGTPGVVLRLLFNRVSDSGALTELYTEIDENRSAEVNLTDLEYAHLNAIKLSYDSPSGIISDIQLVGDGVPSLNIRYNGAATEGFYVSTIGLSYQAEDDYNAPDLLDHTKMKPGLGFTASTVYADKGQNFTNTPTYSNFGSFKAPSGTLTYVSANTDIATINSGTGEGTMKSDNFESSTTITGTFAGTTYFAGSDAATYTVKGTLSLAVNGTTSTTTINAQKGQEIEVIAFADGGATTLQLSNTVGRLTDNNKLPSASNLTLSDAGGNTLALDYGTTETVYYYAKADGPVTLTNTGSNPIRLLSFHAYWRETDNQVNYQKYTDYKKYDDFTDEASPFVYAGGFTLPAPTVAIIDKKTGDDVASQYQLSNNSFVSNKDAATVDGVTGALASNSNRAAVTAITDVTVSAEMTTVGDALGFNPTATVTGPVRVYPYNMTWDFPAGSSTDGLQFTGNYAVSMVGSENRLNIIGNVISSVMIPVQKKQKVVITAHAFRNDNGSGSSQTINLRNAGDIYEETASQTSYNWATQDYEYTAMEDGYLTLKNIYREHYASGRTLSIQKIVVKPQELLFADGPEVSIGTSVGTGSYQNPIINPMDGDVTYTYSTDVTRLASKATFDTSKGIFTANSDGQIFKDSPLGELEVNVTASKGDLVHEQTGSYKLNVLTYNFHESSLTHSYDGTPWTVTHEENALESSASPVPGPDVIYYEYMEGNPKVDIDHVAGSTNYSVALDGLGKVRIVAVSGAISTSFTMEMTAGTKTGFMNSMPSVRNGETTYSQSVLGWEDNVGVTWNLVRQTHDVSCSFNDLTGELTGISGWGVIEVSATKGGDTYTYCLTVQRPLSNSNSYTEQSSGKSWSYNYYTWDFHTDLLHKYVADVPGNMTNDNYISDDLANVVETTDWKWFQRKESSDGNKTQYVHFYKPALQGDNGFVIPETIGLQIESAAFTRTTTGGGTKGFGIINVGEATRTGDKKSASPGAALTASAHRGLSLQEGVTLTIPKLKAGWYVEVLWARLDPSSGKVLRTTNLLDLNGNLINTELQIGRCQDNLEFGGFYTFQVAGDPTDDDDYRDVSFTVMPSGYDDLYQIRVYDGDYQETMLSMRVGQNETNIATLDVNAEASPMRNYRILYDEDANTVAQVNFTYANNLGSPVAPSRVTVTTEGPLDVELGSGVSHAAIDYGSSEREHGYYPYPTVKLLGEYGKFYITYTMYSDDRKYVVATKTYRLKVGLVPHQQYPYTWNFTNIGGGQLLGRSNNAYNSMKADGVTWTAWGYNMFELNTNTIDGSYYVPGATLVTSVRNLGSDGTKDELDAAGDGCDEFNGLGFEGRIAFKTADQDGNDATAVEPTIETELSEYPLLHYKVDPDHQCREELDADNGKVVLGADVSKIIKTVTGVEGYSGSCSYKMDGGGTKNVLLKPQRTFRNGDKIIMKAYYELEDGRQGGFSFYSVSTDDTPLATIYLTDVTKKKLHTLTYTVTPGDGIAGLSQVYLFRADKTIPTMFLTEVEVTTTDTGKKEYERKMKCLEEVKMTIPDLNADGRQDWIYIKSSAAPTGVTNATAAEEGDGLDAADGVLKYKVTAEGSCVVTFASGTTVERIGVTHILKPITTVDAQGWATESRDCAIDHSLTGIFTLNDVNAYTVSVESSTPQGATVKLNAVNDNAASTDDKLNANSGVPAETGLVLKLDATTNLSKANSRGVPLFVPAMTTPVVSYADIKFNGNSGNMMKENLTEKIFTAETEEIGGVNYTAFILAQQYIRWKKTTKEGDGATVESVTHTDAFQTLQPAPAAVFYRLHQFSGSELSGYTDDKITSKTADQLNTLGANKAYLLLPTADLPKALWDNSSGARRYVAILGVSDMEEELGDDGSLVRRAADNRTYDLRGRVVDADNLRPGVYIRGGRKIVVR